MNFVLGIPNQTEQEKKMTNLEKKAMRIAERHVRWPPYGKHQGNNEEFFLLMCKACILDFYIGQEKVWKVPYIQRQRFLELLHFYWLSFSRGLLPLPPL